MRVRRRVAIAILSGIALSCRRRTDESLLVFAAASTKDALSELGRRFEAHGHPPVRFSWGGSGNLARQIAEGAPADVFVSADLAKMEGLEQSGHVAKGARRGLLSNRLVVVVPSGASLPKSLDELASLRKIAIADPKSAPAGSYARAWLEHDGALGRIEPKIVPTLDVRAALAAVEDQAVDAAIVYRTDAAGSKRATIAFEPSFQPKIVYPVAPLARTKNAHAQAFVDFLASAEAKPVFERLGFVVLA